MKRQLLLKEGKRVVVVGKTGSGKSFLIKNLIYTSSVFPILLVDTKVDKNFDEFLDFLGVTIAEDAETAISSIIRFPFVIYRPNPNELLNVEKIDSVLQFMYDFINPSAIIIDEAYTLHSYTNIPRGYFSIITRGRSRGITVVSGMQRPKFVSRFILSEADEFYIFTLNDVEDRERVFDIIQFDEIIDKKLEKYHFFYYSIDEDELIYFSPIRENDEIKEKFGKKLEKILRSRLTLI